MVAHMPSRAAERAYFERAPPRDLGDPVAHRLVTAAHRGPILLGACGLLLIGLDILGTWLHHDSPETIALTASIVAAVFFMPVVVYGIWHSRVTTRLLARGPAEVMEVVASEPDAERRVFRLTLRAPDGGTHTLMVDYPRRVDDREAAKVGAAVVVLADPGDPRRRQAVYGGRLRPLGAGRD